MVAVGDTMNEVLTNTLDKVNLDEAEVITIYYGTDVKPAQAEQIGVNIREQYPQIQVEVVGGGQPHYHYIISIE